MKKYIFILIFTLFPIFVYAQNGSFPILAWNDTNTSLGNYQELADAGFTYCLYGWFESQGEIIDALNSANSVGVKLIPGSPLLNANPENLANLIKNYPAMGGYYIQDEPSATDFSYLSNLVRRIQAVDNLHLS
jgi:hypothetical protein